MFGSFPSQRACLKLHTLSSTRDFVLIFTCDVCICITTHTDAEMSCLSYIYIYKKLNDFTVWRVVLSHRCSLTVFISPLKHLDQRFQFLLILQLSGRWWRDVSVVFLSPLPWYYHNSEDKTMLREWESVPYSQNCWLICFICVGKDSYRYFLWHVRKNSSFKTILVRWCPSLK